MNVFPTYSALTARGWKLDALARINIDLMVATTRDKKHHVEFYTWATTRFGEPVASGVAYSRADYVHAAYAATFGEK